MTSYMLHGLGDCRPELHCGCLGDTRVSPEGLRAYADQVWDVWTEYADDDLSVLAREAVRSLRALAGRVERGR